MADPARLASIHAACFTTPRPWSTGEIASLLSLPHIFVLTDGPAAAAEPGPAPHGFLIGSAIAGEAELLTLAVLPGARRKGAGRRLLAGFLDMAESREAQDIFLEVAADNAAAIALYQAAGFRQSGLRRGYYHRPSGEAVDALVLALRPEETRAPG